MGPNSNVFTVGASATQRQDRSYYKSLYHFNADVELAEYSLPVLSTQQHIGKGSQKLPSGAINATQLPPIQNQRKDLEMKARTGDYDEDHPIDEEDGEVEEGMDQVDERDEEMEDGDMDGYGVSYNFRSSFTGYPSLIRLPFKIFKLRMD